MGSALGIKEERTRRFLLVRKIQVGPVSIHIQLSLRIGHFIVVALLAGQVQRALELRLATS